MFGPLRWSMPKSTKPDAKLSEIYEQNDWYLFSGHGVDITLGILFRYDTGGLPVVYYAVPSVFYQRILLNRILGKLVFWNFTRRISYFLNWLCVYVCCMRYAAIRVMNEWMNEWMNDDDDDDADESI